MVFVVWSSGGGNWRGDLDAVHLCRAHHSHRRHDPWQILPIGTMRVFFFILFYLLWLFKSPPTPCIEAVTRLHGFLKTHFCFLRWIVRITVADPEYPGSEFFPYLIRILSIPDPRSASKNLSILTQKIVCKLSEIWSGLFIPDPDPDFLPIPDPGTEPGVKKALDPGSGPTTLVRIRRTCT